MSNALEVETMNRQQRRRHEKLVTWIDSLSKDKQAIIDSVVRDRSSKITLSNMVNFQMAFSAALITLHEEKLNMNEIQELIILANRYSEDKTYMNKYGKEWMIMFEKQREDMKNRMKELYEEGIKSQNAMVKAIKREKEFKEIPQKDVVVIWKELKDELNGLVIKDMKESEDYVDKALDYIFKGKKLDSSHPQIEKKEEIENKEEEKMPRLEVIKKELVLKGEFGEYLVNENGVNSGEKSFKDMKELEKYEKEEIATFARRMTELKSVMGYI